MIADKKLILQVIDPSHAHWVLGGIFMDLRCSSTFFASKPVIIPQSWRILSPKRAFSNFRTINAHNFLLFSSITPLVNYLRFFKIQPGRRLLLFFTHLTDDFSRLEIEALNSTDVIFVMSKSIKNQLSKFTETKIIVALSAIDPDRFQARAIIGSKIVWVGTPALRKRPEMLISLASLNPDLEFKLLGKGWETSKFWRDVCQLTNLEYAEVSGPLTSADFDGCDIFLSTSTLEGGPMPLMESLAAGLIPIVTDTGFCRDFVEICGLPQELILKDFSSFRSLVDNIRQDSRLTIDRDIVKKFSFEALANLIANSK
jgi:glycosyltransferase involved in cell wall biosynthesis